MNLGSNRPRAWVTGDRRGSLPPERGRPGRTKERLAPRGPSAGAAPQVVRLGRVVAPRVVGAVDRDSRSLFTVAACDFRVVHADGSVIVIGNARIGRVPRTTTIVLDE